MLIKMLVDSVSKGGNLLLNVGPNGRGEFDQRSIERLNEIGDWMRVNARSIYGADRSEWEAPVDCRYTPKRRSSKKEIVYMYMFFLGHSNIFI